MLSADGTIEAKRFTGIDISTNGTIVTPSQPFRTISGYKTIYIVLNDPNELETTIASEDVLVDVDGLARIVTSGGENYDVITMTGKSESQIYIEPDITIQDVNNGANRIEVTVTRVASRAIVTTSASTTLTNSDGVTIGTLSNLTYSIAQGTKEIYWLPQTNYVSYGYDYVTALGNYVTQAPIYYDYSDLDNPTPIPILPTASDGYKSLTGKFLFENTHVYGSDTKSTGYRKGNTAYVLVRVVLTPDASQIADGGTLTNGTFYVGQADGLIYSTKQAAQNAIQNQKVAVYTGGKMLYYAWLNPDNITSPLNSPVVRNNIYHVNITGFTSLGYNWNPLYSEDPDTTTPDNPDPKPGNPDEPDIPIDPVDPLTPEETHMTVEITVTDWYVHSYDIEF
ncbi:MAG: Mfa1 family fimbria major subunit [Rikenellaceae bacterium]|nr:Mfa1 family fimbria major subunit [Rikenellaceae bacterium]